MKEFTNVEEIKQAVKNGKDVFYGNCFYKVKIDFEGDFVVKCTQNSSQELLTDKHNLSEFYIF